MLSKFLRMLQLSYMLGTYTYRYQQLKCLITVESLDSDPRQSAQRAVHSGAEASTTKAKTLSPVQETLIVRLKDIVSFLHV